MSHARSAFENGPGLRDLHVGSRDWAGITATQPSPFKGEGFRYPHEGCVISFRRHDTSALMLDQPKVAQAGMAVASDDHVVVQYHAERGGGFFLMSWVTAMSALDGVGSPEGWLCTMTILTPIARADLLAIWRFARVVSILRVSR